MLKLDNISLKYGKNTVIDSLSYDFAQGKVTLIRGASGVGKTSLLNIMAGLIKPSSGKVTLNAPRIAYVFQEPRLFEWLTVLENVSTVSDEPRAVEMLSLMHLSDSVSKYPSELSGGMKQRVSIARALAYDADIVFLDEPFKGLDSELRREISDIVFDKLRGKTVILVSHDESDSAYADIELNLYASSLVMVKSNI